MEAEGKRKEVERGQARKAILLDFQDNNSSRKALSRLFLQERS
jgi:hypothetical protein